MLLLLVYAIVDVCHVTQLSQTSVVYIIQSLLVVFAIIGVCQYATCDSAARIRRVFNIILVQEAGLCEMTRVKSIKNKIFGLLSSINICMGPIGEGWWLWGRNRKFWGIDFLDPPSGNFLG